MKSFLFIIYIFSLCSYAQDDVYFPEKSKGELYEYAEFTNAGSLDLNLKDVRRSPLLHFQELESNNQSAGFTSDNYWIRFKLENSNAESKTYYLETGRPITDFAELYQISKTKTEIFKSGDQIDFKDKQVNHRSTIFKIKLPPSETQQIYIHLKSDGETINLPLNLYDEALFWEKNYLQQFFLGLFYGLLLLAGIIYLFFYNTIKEKAFLYYGLYVFSICLMQAALDGFIHEYIFTNASFINSRIVLITALFSNFYLLKYCEHFLHINTHLKSYKTAYYVAYGILALLFILIFINSKSLEIVYPISNLNGLFSLILILSSVFTLRYKNIEIDSYFSFGILFLVIGLLGFVMNNLSLVPNNFYTLNSSKFGSGLEVIFLSLSMTNLIKFMRIQKEKLQEEALIKSEEIGELKTYFMSNMSHELRTPINAIMGIAEIELGRKKNKKTNESFEIIKNASISLLSNVNDIIDFEKIENNKLKLSPVVFNPTIKLQEISDNWQIEAAKKGLAYKFDLDNRIPEKILADSTRFLQIINNVLANALKFTDKGSIYFKLICNEINTDTCQFSIQISDTGIGIDENSIKNVFESFSQMRLNHKREFGGIGLGLTIAYHIVKLFDGEIKINSEINRGTSVFINLNFRYISEEQKSVKSIINTYRNKPLKILIAEDNKINQMVLSRILKTQKNISFTITNNGKEAIENLKIEHFDIILMDLQMPIMDGYEATQIIKNGSLGSTIESIPIIAITADAIDETKEHVLKLGMCDYITKPLNQDLLFEKIYTHCFPDSILKIA
ncbi:hybrid sensor histidine kinase/response regulator [Algibacter sp. L4_22]|uniref:hybrid sensor histidine kinase/response regulator n=1 Tax=Algibacter sp. L4_22 TaxID=2942477 RepID=UPI00201B8176|nr:hybrid sensor histidine kinase/response regulator [Algibacter sp. L4_22]MCL5127470.1 response regulator [Algibacter sp. L4_22]